MKVICLNPTCRATNAAEVRLCRVCGRDLPRPKAAEPTELDVVRERLDRALATMDNAIAGLEAHRLNLSVALAATVRAMGGAS